MRTTSYTGECAMSRNFVFESPGVFESKRFTKLQQWHIYWTAISHRNVALSTTHSQIDQC
jgi:hypothetical protein